MASESKNVGAKLWEKAKKIIPGGTQMLSKRSEHFLPKLWPAYFKKAKGVRVWTLEGKQYLDMSYMGVGSCILGYADPDVNRAVKDVIDGGSMCTLNSPEEVELAELLLKLHPWADMVRYARTGGEAMAVAVRIARASTGKDKVAFCGYHGWSDWYLAANLADEKALDGHLLPGLKPLGVPRALKGTAIPFRYNKIEELEKIVDNNDIGTIVMEPRREREPKNKFLQKVRKIADRIGAVLIFDEVSSGWRVNVGGIHMYYRVYPDLAVFGKAMSNGFPMAAVIGKREIMDVAQDSFISSTYWTERVGPAAAIATITKMSECQVPRHICKVGKEIKRGWVELAESCGLELEVVGLPSVPTFKFNYGELNQALYTFFTQEMLEKGFLATKTVYVSYSHRKSHLNKYFKSVEMVFKKIAGMKKKEVYSMLKGPVALEGFKRLTA